MKDIYFHNIVFWKSVPREEKVSTATTRSVSLVGQQILGEMVTDDRGFKDNVF